LLLRGAVSIHQRPKNKNKNKKDPDEAQSVTARTIKRIDDFDGNDFRTAMLPVRAARKSGDLP